MINVWHVPLKEISILVFSNSNKSFGGKQHTAYEHEHVDVVPFFDMEIESFLAKAKQDRSRHCHRCIEEQTHELLVASAARCADAHATIRDFSDPVSSENRGNRRLCHTSSTSF